MRNPYINRRAKYSDAEAKAAAVNNSITDGNTDTAPSEDAVHDALAGKAGATATVVAKSGGDYTDLSDAVDAASAGDTILVYPGTYTDSLLEKRIRKWRLNIKNILKNI